MTYYPLAVPVFVCRYHHSLPHLSGVLCSVSWTDVVVGVQPLHRDANLQLSVRDADHFQCRTPAGSLPLPAPPVPAARAAGGCVRQVKL